MKGWQDVIGGADDNLGGRSTEGDGKPLRQDDQAAEEPGNRPLDGVEAEVRQESDQAALGCISLTPFSLHPAGDRLGRLSFRQARPTWMNGPAFSSRGTQ